MKCANPKCSKEAKKGKRGHCYGCYKSLNLKGYYTSDRPPRNYKNRTIRTGYKETWCPIRKKMILEHRKLFEDKLGRFLEPNENVHHINGIRDDNRMENLELWIVPQPYGQRASDLVRFAEEVIRKYKDIV